MTKSYVLLQHVLPNYKVPPTCTFLISICFSFHFCWSWYYMFYNKALLYIQFFRNLGIIERASSGWQGSILIVPEAAGLCWCTLRVAFTSTVYQSINNLLYTRRENSSANLFLVWSMIGLPFVVRLHNTKQAGNWDAWLRINKLFVFLYGPRTRRFLHTKVQET